MKKQLKKAILSMLAIATITITVQATPPPPTPASVLAMHQELSDILSREDAKQYLAAKGASGFEGLSKPGIRNLASIIAHNPKTKFAYDHRRSRPSIIPALWLEDGIGIFVNEDGQHEAEIFLSGALDCGGNIVLVELIGLHYITEHTTWAVNIELINSLIFVPEEDYKEFKDKKDRKK